MRSGIATISLPDRAQCSVLSAHCLTASLLGPIGIEGRMEVQVEVEVEAQAQAQACRRKALFRNAALVAWGLPHWPD